MIVLGLLAAALVAGGIAFAVVIIIKKGSSDDNMTFEVLDVEEKKDLEQVSQTPSSMLYDEDKTIRLFDDQTHSPVLKSYVLEIYDLRNPGQGYRVNVDDRITVGRGSGCTVCVPNRTLSSQHCEIVLDNGTLILRDLNSLNGTYLNGNPNRVSEARLESGSIIQIGSEKLQVQLKEVTRQPGRVQ